VVSGTRRLDDLPPLVSNFAAFTGCLNDINPCQKKKTDINPSPSFSTRVNVLHGSQSDNHPMKIL
jgi:hypothetical protein